MICRDIRRRWLQYGENRDILRGVCSRCRLAARPPVRYDIDHIEPLGARPRRWEDLGDYTQKMFERKCQALCKPCHKEKTDRERKRRKSA